MRSDSFFGGIFESEENFLLADFLAYIHALRNHLSSELPIQNSLIALDILNNVAVAYFRGEPLSVKALMGSLPHSPAGLRYHYTRLIDTDWIMTVHDDLDARVRWVKPTGKLLKAYQEVLTSCGMAI